VLFLLAGGGGTLMIGGLVLAGAFYLLPTLVATSDHHPHTQSIFVVNFFLGWTLIGWVVALAWATMPITPRR